jgi:hypothetical protein
LRLRAEPIAGRARSSPLDPLAILFPSLIAGLPQ